MTEASCDLAGLMCSRLCHDLMSPVGALANGLELLSDESDAEMRRRCLSLVDQSARISAAKLRFFRVAFGSHAGGGEMMPSAELRSLIEGLAGSAQRMTIGWSVPGKALPRAAAKTLLNFAMIGIDALVRGGTLDIGAEGEHPEATSGRFEIVVRASGPRVAADPEIARALQGELPDHALSARTAPAAMVHRLATGLGGAIQVATGPDMLLIGAELVVPDEAADAAASGMATA